MPCLPTAQGEKLRRGGQLPAAIFLQAVCGSTPALRPVLPVRFRAKSAVHFALSSSYRLGWVSLSLRLRSLPNYYGGNVKMRPIYGIDDKPE